MEDKMNFLARKETIKGLIILALLFLFSYSATAEVTCPAGTTKCQNACVNLTSDKANCGRCNYPCPAGAECKAGACVCPAGTTMCQSGCVSLVSDKANCGRCGYSCSRAMVCESGSCK